MFSGIVQLSRLVLNDPIEIKGQPYVLRCMIPLTRDTQTIVLQYLDGYVESKRSGSGYKYLLGWYAECEIIISHAVMYPDYPTLEIGDIEIIIYSMGYYDKISLTGGASMQFKPHRNDWEVEFPGPSTLILKSQYITFEIDIQKRTILKTREVVLC